MQNCSCSKQSILFVIQHHLQDLDRTATSGITAEKVMTLLDFAQFYKLVNKPVPSGIDHIVEGMEAYGFCRKEEGAWSVTNLGAVLLPCHWIRL